MKRMTEESFAQFQPWLPYLKVLTKSEAVTFDRVAPGKRVIFAHIERLGDVGIEAPEAFDFEVARKKLRKQLDEVVKYERQHEARLQDENFLRKADPETVTEAQQRREVLRGQNYLLSEQLRQIEEAN
jgi:valyl-tRNA synthetase